METPAGWRPAIEMISAFPARTAMRRGRYGVLVLDCPQILLGIGVQRLVLAGAPVVAYGRTDIECNGVLKNFG